MPQEAFLTASNDRVYRTSPTYAATSSSAYERPISYERSSNYVPNGSGNITYSSLSSEPSAYRRSITYERAIDEPVSYTSNAQYAFSDSTKVAPWQSAIASVSYERYPSPSFAASNSVNQSYARISHSTMNSVPHPSAYSSTDASNYSYSRVPIVESSQYHSSFQRPSISYERSAPTSYERRQSVERISPSTLDIPISYQHRQPVERVSPSSTSYDVSTPICYERSLAPVSYERYAAPISYQRSVVYDQPSFQTTFSQPTSSVSSVSYSQPSASISYARTIPASNSYERISGTSYPFETVRSTSPYAQSRATSYSSATHERAAPATSYEWPSSSSASSVRRTVYNPQDSYTTVSTTDVAGSGEQYASYPSRTSYTSYSAIAADSGAQARVHATAF